MLLGDNSPSVWCFCVSSEQKVLTALFRNVLTTDSLGKIKIVSSSGKI